MPALNKAVSMAGPRFRIVDMAVIFAYYLTRKPHRRGVSCDGSVLCA
jgi:hypothetical protein